MHYIAMYKKNNNKGNKKNHWQLPGTKDKTQKKKRRQNNNENIKIQ